MLQRPAYLANREVGKLDDYIGGLGIAQPPRISIKDDRFTLLDETGMALAEATLSIDVVIIGVNKNASRIFYEKKVDQFGNKMYEANNHDAPLCWSDNGTGPSKSCSMPQAPTCGSCPNAVWGSDVGLGGRPIPACGTVKKAAVLVSGHEGIFLLSIPPGSLSSLKQYISTLAKMPASPEEIITRVKMENKELLFDAADWVPADYMPFIETTIKNDDAATIVNRFDEARDPNEFRALPAPTTSPQPQTLSQTPVGQPLPPQQPSGPPPATRPVGRPVGSGRKQQQLAAPPQQPPQPSQYAPPAPPAPPPPQQQWGPPPQGEVLPPQTHYAPPQQPNGGQPPVGFGFGMQGQPAQPDAKVTSMLSSAFNLPRRT